MHNQKGSVSALNILSSIFTVYELTFKHDNTVVLEHSRVYKTHIEVVVMHSLQYRECHYMAL